MIIACTGGNDVPLSVIVGDVAVGTVIFDLVPCEMTDDATELDSCDNEASVKFASFDPIPSKFKCSIQIDNNWLGAVFTPPYRTLNSQRSYFLQLLKITKKIIIIIINEFKRKRKNRKRNGELNNLMLSDFHFLC